MLIGALDLAALGLFAFAVLGYSVIIDYGPLRRRSLNHAINQMRIRWMEQIPEHHLRMMDTNLLNGLQTGIAFFASTSLLGVGAGFTLLTAADKLIPALNDPALPAFLHMHVTITEFYAKVVGVIIIFAYAFFKFGWAYRLFNYTLILAGAIPVGTPIDGSRLEVSEEARALAHRAANMSIVASAQFNSGMRAIFFAMAYLCWFAGPWLFMAATSFVTFLVIYRQFGSPARRVLVQQDLDFTRSGRTG